MIIGDANVHIEEQAATEHDFFDTLERN